MVHLDGDWLIKPCFEFAALAAMSPLLDQESAPRKRINDFFKGLWTVVDLFCNARVTPFISAFRDFVSTLAVFGGFVSVPLHTAIVSGNRA